MSSNRIHNSRIERDEQHAAQWAKRRDIPIAILAWLILGGLVLWATGYIARSLLVVLVAALLAFALTPAVKFLQRFMPRIIAVIIVYLGVFGVISFLLYMIINTTIGEVSSLSNNIQKLF